MLDINLFSPYIEEKKEIKNMFKYAFIGLATLVIISGLYTLWYYSTINTLEKNILEMNNLLDSEDIQVRLLELDRKREEITLLDEYYNSVKDVNSEIDNINKINTDVIDSINASIPNSIYFKSMNIASNIVQIQGISDDRIAVAQLQEKLNKKEEFSNVYIPSITTNSSNDSYTFLLNLRIEGDNNDIE